MVWPLRRNLIDPRMGLQNAVEHGVHVRDIGADDTRRIRHDDGGFPRGFLNAHRRVCAARRYRCRRPAPV